MKNKAIAKDLGLSGVTVGWHCRNMVQRGILSPSRRASNKDDQLEIQRLKNITTSNQTAQKLEIANARVLQYLEDVSSKRDI